MIMKKKNYSNVNLTCAFQNTEELSGNQCLNGVFSKTDNGFLFEEAVRKGRPPRNPKLFDGKYISMVKMQNGRYQCHLKTMDKGFDKRTFAEEVYQDIVNALKIID